MSDVNDYVFGGEGSEPTVNNPDCNSSTESVEEYVFGSEAEVSSNIVIPAPGEDFTNKFLKANGAYSATWEYVIGTAAWGAIIGTLSDQADLQAALDAKVDKVTGYGLSQNDLTDSLKSTYDGYAAQISGKEDTGVAAGLMSTHLSTYAHGDIAHANRSTLDLISAAFTTALKATYDGYASTIAGKEPSLGNPSVSGYVLSSTDAGVRSWIAQTSVITNHSSLSQLDYANSGHIGFEPTVTKGNLTEATSSILTISGGTNSVIGSGVSIQVKLASGEQSGYLSSTDWNTFNNKSDFSGSYNDLSDKPTIPTALADLSDDATHRLVTDTEKSTWNGKQDALGYTPVPDTRTINSKQLNTDITLTYSDVGAQVAGSYQTENANLTSLSALSYSATAFVKMTGANTFALDTTTYEPTLTKGNLTEATSSVLTISGGTNAVIGSGTTIAVQQADATHAGYLSSTDWTTFNNKQAALTFGIANDNAVEIDSASVASGEYAKFTANGLESKSIAEVQSDLDVLTKTVEINAQTGTTYTLQSSDNGKLITLNNGSAITVTVPSGLGAGFNCQLLQLGAGQVSVSESSTTINNASSHTSLTGQYSSASLVAYAANTFLFQGDTV